MKTHRKSRTKSSFPQKTFRMFVAFAVFFGCACFTLQMVIRPRNSLGPLKAEDPNTHTHTATGSTHNSPGRTGLAPNSPGRTGLAPNSPGRTGLALNSPGRIGLALNSPGRTGLALNSPGRIGLAPNSPGRTGLALNSPGRTGLAPNSPGRIGLALNSPGRTGLTPNSPGRTGLTPNSPGRTGLTPDSPGRTGLTPNSPGRTGLTPNSPAPRENIWHSPAAKVMPGVVIVESQRVVENAHSEGSVDRTREDAHSEGSVDRTREDAHSKGSVDRTREDAHSEGSVDRTREDAHSEGSVDRTSGRGDARTSARISGREDAHSEGSVDRTSGREDAHSEGSVDRTSGRDDANSEGSVDRTSGRGDARISGREDAHSEGSVDRTSGREASSSGMAPVQTQTSDHWPVFSKEYFTNNPIQASPYERDFTIVWGFNTSAFLLRPDVQGRPSKLMTWMVKPRYVPDLPELVRLRACPEMPCHMTTNTSVYWRNSSALLWAGQIMREPEPPNRTHPDQVFVFHNNEPQLQSWIDRPSFRRPAWRSVFNWTMTNRFDSDLSSLFGYIVQKETPVLSRNYSEIVSKKTGLVAWLVSNCETEGGREWYVGQLKRYLRVDVYGGCSCTTQCPRSEEGECFSMISRTYKFYLSFESAFCKEYVSEKLFRYLASDAIAVTRGSNDYKNHAPPEIFINTADFKSPKELADHLLYLDRHPEEYVRLLKAKDRYLSVTEDWPSRFQNGSIYYIEYHFESLSFCEMCRRLWEVDKHRKTVPDIVRWFDKQNCYPPSDLPPDLMWGGLCVCVCVCVCVCLRVRRGAGCARYIAMVRQGYNYYYLPPDLKPDLM